MDQFLTQTFAGEVIQKTISVISLTSSIAFMVLLEQDHASTDECCKPWYDAGKPEGQMPMCNPPCNAYFYSRMPRWFEMAD